MTIQYFLSKGNQSVNSNRNADICIMKVVYQCFHQVDHFDSISSKIVLAGS